ncbi:MAG: patatin-like phospholipase family protein [Micavibrio sp.]
MFDKPPPIIVLFNYGGGLRGLIPAQIMARIELDTGLRMADMVDVFAGPSTGAILNAALTLRNPEDSSRPKYRARHLVRFYEREAERIFPPDRFREFRGLIHDFNNRTMRISQLNSIFRHGHYNPTNLGRSLRALYGDAKLAHSMRSLIIPAYNIDGMQLQALKDSGESEQAPVHTRGNFMDTGGHALWLKNMKVNKGLLEGIRHSTPDVALYDAVMASTAAPTYFPCHNFEARWPGYLSPHQYTAIDGSIFDNPSITYVGAVRQHLLPGQETIMIGLGTGYTNKSIKKDDWNRYGSLGVVDPANDLPLINIFFHATESALLDAFEAEMKGNLFLFNKSLVTNRLEDSPSAQMDDGSPLNMKRLKDFADGIIEDNKKQYDYVCDLLVTNYEKRKSWIESVKPSRWKKIFSYIR